MRVGVIVLALALAAAPPMFAAKSKKAATKKSSKKKTASRRVPPKQTQPTPERYREIQQALIDRGFLQGAPTGIWDEETVEAWKRFEESQNLPVDGKLDSKALIALGLGPKRQAALVQPAPE